MVLEFLKKNIVVAFVIIFAVLASLPLFHSGFFPMHDDVQIARLFDLNQALGFGQFPPRIAPNLGYGYGYPFFNFYPPFAYYVGEVFHLVGFGYILSTKLMLFAGFLLSAFFAYLLGKELFGKEAGVLAAAFYTFAPYHAVDVYARGAFAEFFSFVFIPLVFWSALMLARTKKIVFTVPLALSITFLILSHNLIFIMTAPFAFLWFLYLIYGSNNKKALTFWLVTSSAIGFGISAYFSLPSFFERDFTLIRILTSELADYRLHFVCVPQLWNSAWGYGGSIPDCNDGLSFEVGKIHLIASFLAIGIFALYFLREKIKREAFVVPLFFVFLLISMFLTVRHSKIIWDFLTPFSYIQFPWRFLTLAVFFSSLTAASIVMLINNKKLKLLATVILVAAVIILNLPNFVPQKYLDVHDADYISREKIRWETSNLAYEYVPAKIKTKKSQYNTTQVDINKNEIATSSYQIVKGDLKVNVLKDLPQEKIFQTKSDLGGILRINTYSFPGWKVYIDGKSVSYRDSNKLVLVDVTVPPGQHIVHSVFTNTPIRTFGNSASIISIILLLVIYIFYGRKTYTKA